MALVFTVLASATAPKSEMTNRFGALPPVWAAAEAASRIAGIILSNDRYFPKLKPCSIRQRYSFHTPAKGLSVSALSAGVQPRTSRGFSEFSIEPRKDLTSSETCYNRADFRNPMQGFRHAHCGRQLYEQARSGPDARSDSSLIRRDGAKAVAADHGCVGARRSREFQDAAARIRRHPTLCQLERLRPQGSQGEDCPRFRPAGGQWHLRGEPFEIGRAHV